LPTTAPTFGGYGFWQIQNYVIGFKGYGFNMSSRSGNNLEYSASGGAWSLNLGYKVINKDKFGLYPFIGFGYSGITYSIASTLGEDISIPVTTPSFNNAEYQWNNFMAELGLRVEHFFGYKGNEESGGGGIVGLEVGYQFTPVHGDWSTKGGAGISGAPNYDMGGFYASVLIGGFGGKKR
jgi:hypothetical protein